MAIFDRLGRSLRHRVADFEESGMGYWRIRVQLADGRIFTNVYITDAFALGFPQLTPFLLSDISAVSWDEPRGNERSGAPREFISEPPISPWSDLAALPSPDGRRRAVMFDATEMAMGGPSLGTVSVYDDAGRCIVTVDGCNPSMVWSDDSRRLAIPQWSASRMQRLVIVDAAAGKFSVGVNEYHVLRLERFEGDVVHAIDSPIHAPATLAITIGAG